MGRQNFGHWTYTWIRSPKLKFRMVDSSCKYFEKK